MTLLILVCALVIALVSGQSVQQGAALHLQVNSSRPVTLYKGAPTGRRDARGQALGSVIIRAVEPAAGGQRRQPKNYAPIVVTSRPFGFNNNRPVETTTTTSTTTTSRPAGYKVQPTIPFFSISCSVGSSCSQIISAREVSTQRPTFKPYTQQEIEKNREIIRQFLPYLDKLKSSAEVTSPPATTTTRPVTITRRAVTTTTQTPTTSTTTKANSVWRVRTTPAPRLTNTASSSLYSSLRSTTQSSNDIVAPSKKSPAVNKPVWKWETPAKAAAEERSQVEAQTESFRPIVKWEPMRDVTWRPLTEQRFQVETQTESFKLSTWTLPQETATQSPFVQSTPGVRRRNRPKVKPKTTPRPTYQGNWLSLLSAAINGQAVQGSPDGGVRHVQQLVALKPPRLASNLVKIQQPNAEDIVHYSVPSWSDTKNSVIWNEEADVGHREIVSTKGNKISLITGSSRRTPTPKPVSTFLPEEVAVSSHVIGLRVKPKSLGPSFHEEVQGVNIETDGQDINLTDLIMKENIPRPARYLPETAHYQQPIQHYSPQAGQPEIARSRQHTPVQNQPIRFPALGQQPAYPA